MNKLGKLWLLMLLGIAVTLVVRVAPVQSRQQYDEYDDDFGEFDDEDDMAERRRGGRVLDVDSIYEEEDEATVVSDEEEEEEQPVVAETEKLVMVDEEEAMVESEDGDEFSHLSDEEEFIGYTSESASPPRMQPRKEAAKEPRITIANVPLHLRSNWDSFYLELMLLAGLLVYFTNFSLGRSRNARMAQAWFDAHKTLLMQQFALVGDDGKAPSSEHSNGSSSSNGSTDSSKSTALAAAAAAAGGGGGGGGGSAGLQKDSENIYTLYCSGRSCVHSMMVELRFIKRQDVVSLVTQVFRPSQDEAVIKLRLEDMDTFVLCLAAKKTANKYAKEMTDISTYCPGERKSSLAGKQYSSAVSSKFVVWSELSEATQAVLGDQRTVAVLSKHLARINYLHISDQYAGPRQPDQDQQPVATQTGDKMPEVHKMMLLSYQLQPGAGAKGAKGESTGGAEDMESVRPIMLLVLHLADKLCRLRLSKESKSKAAVNRSRVEEAFHKAAHAVRAERAQEKREEKRREEREKIMEIDDPEKQRKWEERENKRAAKRKGPKMKQLKVA